RPARRIGDATRASGHLGVLRMLREKQVDDDDAEPAFGEPDPIDVPRRLLARQHDTRAFERIENTVELRAWLEDREIDVLCRARRTPDAERERASNRVCDAVLVEALTDAAGGFDRVHRY